MAASCEDVNPAPKERPVLEAVTKRSEDRDWIHYSLYDSFVKCSDELCVNVFNPTPVYSHSIALQNETG
jgi:hypothetical protein